MIKGFPFEAPKLTLNLTDDHPGIGSDSDHPEALLLSAQRVLGIHTYDAWGNSSADGELRDPKDLLGNAWALPNTESAKAR